MDQGEHKDAKQTTLPFRCVKVPLSERSGDHPAACLQEKFSENQGSACALASPTPEKISHPPRTRKGKELRYRLSEKAENSSTSPDSGGKNKLVDEGHNKRELTDVSFPKDSGQRLCFSIPSLEKSVQISDKYNVIYELFSKMVISVRLLGLRKRPANFQNISTQVEVLAKKKFMLRHLAQMKFLYPEALHIERTLVHDETSLCMKPDVKVSLILDAAKHIDNTCQASHVDLCQIFHAKLLNFLETHPEGSEIPEAYLPGIAMQGNSTTSSNQSPEGAFMEHPWPASGDDDATLGASHLCPSFSQHFSGRMLKPEDQTTETFDSSLSNISMDPISEQEKIENHLENCYSHPLTNYEPPTETMSNSKACPQSHQRTPSKCATTPIKLMTGTPSMSTPKRPVTSPDLKLLSQNDMLNNSARRSLIYSPSKPFKNIIQPVAGITDSFCHRISSSKEICVNTSSSDDETKGHAVGDLHMAQEDAADYVTNSDIGQVGYNRRQQMVSFLPDLFSTISSIFGSKNCTSITKQELVHKIISYNSDIEDTDDIEEQLHLLEELAPDWICQKALASGDIMYSISRACDPKSVCSRLLEAV